MQEIALYRYTEPTQSRHSSSIIRTSELRRLITRTRLFDFTLGFRACPRLNCLFRHKASTDFTKVNNLLEFFKVQGPCICAGLHDPEYRMAAPRGSVPSGHLFIPSQTRLLEFLDLL